MNARDYVRIQMELTTEFGQYIEAHKDLDAQIPDGAYIYFEVDGELEFNRQSQILVDQHVAAGEPVAMVTTRGLDQPLGSRVINPAIRATPGREGRQ
jgi:hypothetical protein